MSRMALAAASLVAAIPAGILAFLAIKSLLSSFGDMQTIVSVVTIGVTVVGVLVALLPVVILVGKRRAPAAPVKSKAEKAAEKAAVVAGAQTAEVVTSDVEDELESDDTEAISAAEDFGDTGDFKFEDDAFMEDELMEAEPEPEPEPKKKKKTR